METDNVLERLSRVGAQVVQQAEGSVRVLNTFAQACVKEFQLASSECDTLIARICQIVVKG